MRNTVLLLGTVLVLGGCSTRSIGGVPIPTEPGDVILDDDGRGDRERARSPGEVPPGHYPPPGECRIWYVNRPPGHQPPPSRCDSLVGRVPYGAFLLYNRKAWDTEYDWRREESRRPGSVPEAVLRIMTAVRRR
jgi:hypothetical protein